MATSSVYHLFSLPPEILQTLTPRTLVNQETTPSIETLPEAAPVSSSARSCNVCLGAGFSDVDDQRSHFRSDWHRYNVKARLTNKKAVTEAEFANLVESLEDSLSGSASSDDDDDDGDDSESDAVKNLLAKTRVQSRSPSPTSVVAIPQSSLTWFHSPPSTQIGIYRAVLPINTDKGSYLSELKKLQSPVPQGRKWTLFMVAGGHFAGVVVRVSRPGDTETTPAQKTKQKKPVPEMEILRHKTFHRYTTRRKQGGSQSLNDNAKGNAKSAGALLRRYGEQALRDDIRNLIEEWAEDISASDRIWLRASGSNRRIFLDYEGAMITKGDERLRTFPFPTRRPTQAELSRCLMELTRVKVSHFTEEELKAQDEAFLASIPKPKPRPTVTAPEPKVTEKKILKLSKEEELLRDKWTRFLDMIEKGRLEPAKAFWERESASLGNVNTPIPSWTGEKTGTLLQLASSSGQADITAWLLDDLHADPTIPAPTRDVDAESNTYRTAYDLASTRAVRDAFRRSAAARPDEWDWLGDAHLPSVLNKEMEEERDSKKKERRKGLKEKIKSREAKERETEPLPPSIKQTEEKSKPQISNGKVGPQKLGGATIANEGIAGLTPEMRAKIERERRARAAEARFKTLGGK